MSSNPDDIKLFRDQMSGVAPIQSDRRVHHVRRPAPTPKQTIMDEEAVVADLLSDYPRLDDYETGDELLFWRKGLQKATLRKLRRGDIVVELELDLHGDTIPKARESLVKFLNWCLANQIRCVRIIHGKGLGSPGRKPVLKSKLDKWLRQRDEILAFCSAKPHDGGSGAVYVLLKKKTT